MKMENKYLLLLAFDSLLIALDDEYERLPEEQLKLIESKVYEHYGLKITSSKEDLNKINALLIQEVKEYRDKIVNEL